MKQTSPAATCPIYMTKVAISQKKVSDNFYQIQAHAADELAPNFIYWNHDPIQWRRNWDFEANVG